MGKHGPCYHCGVTNTPLWRNGPPEKPVLCNACGSRWRTKGTLVNYTPLHARSEPDEFEDQRVSRVNTISIVNKGVKVLKRKKNYDNLVGGGGSSMLTSIGGGGHAHDHHKLDYHKGLDEDTGNRSSSGSAISNSDSSIPLCSADVSDLTGPAQSSVVWDTTVPSRKRTCVNRPKQSSVEKLTKDLYTILHEQQSYFSGSSEDDLIFESDTPMVSVEIGHGSVLIRHPNLTAREEESEASSLSVDTKNEAYSQLTTFPICNANKGGKFSSCGIAKSKKPMDQDETNRENDEKLPILMNHKSPLCHIDLKHVINFEEFASQMTNNDQQQLLKYLPVVDTAHMPDSVKNMFDSTQFKDNLSSFQKLLAEGVFDTSSPVVKNESFRTLKKLALSNPTKLKWVEKYNLLQDSKCKYYHGGSLVAGVCNTIAPNQSEDVKKPWDAQFHSFPGMKMKGRHEEKDLLALPWPDNSSLMLDPLKHAGDEDVLVDVPSHTSFPQAQLLPSTTTK